MTLVSRIRAGVPLDVFRDGIAVFGALISANVLTYVFYSLVSRALGVVEAGIFAALLAAMLVGSLPSAVVAVVFAKASADRVAAGDLGEVRGFGLGASAAAIVVGAGAGLFLALFPTAFTNFFRSGDARTVAFVVVGYALTFAIPMQRGVLQGAGAFTLFTVSNVLEALGKVAAGIVVYSVSRDMLTGLAGYAAAECAAYAFNIWAIVTHFPRGNVRWKRAAADLVKRSYGIILPIGSITLMTFLDVVLVRHYLPGPDAGLYAVAALFGRALVTVIAFVPTVLLPKAVERIAAGRSPLPLLVTALWVTAIIAAGTLAATASVPKLIVDVLAGPAFQSAVPLLFPYAVAMTGLAGATVLSTYLIALGERAFALPLALVAAGEAAAIAQRHASLDQVLQAIIAGHLGGCVVCLIFAARSRHAGIPRPALPD